MTVLEVCRAFGLSDGSPLTAALRRGRCPTNAVSMAGRGIHAGVAAAVLRWLDARALLPAHPTYASSCSGVDFFAAALHERGAFAYMHAAECDKQCRAVLMDAWGLAAARIHEDAASAAARTAAHVDLYVASPSCVDFSARRHGRDDAVVAEGALDANSTVGFILDGRARVVVVENVAERDGVAAITTILARAPYDWRFAELDPRLATVLLAFFRLLTLALAEVVAVLALRPVGALAVFRVDLVRRPAPAQVAARPAAAAAAAAQHVRAAAATSAVAYRRARPLAERLVLFSDEGGKVLRTNRIY
mmetsp:Transcript_2247/g.4961  ORF Transcript_2247/g.4961 Transcript_2247/m.4961 type:complete len:305 (-) Transcript_2247:352-1266(-)